MEDPFPEEVWDLILDKLVDPRDAWNVFKAFPHLDLNPTLQKKKRIWLFGLVIPHLFESDSWLEDSDLWNCRLVCKQWSSSVDTFLEEQPQLRAYPPQSLQSRRLFHWNLKPYLDPQSYYFEYFGGTKFQIKDLREGEGRRSSARFVREIMKSHPPERSPFLSRHLYLSLTDVNDGTQEIANNIITLLQRFGEHVWFFEVSFPIGGISAACMAEAFRHLSNLRSIEVRTGESDTRDPDDDFESFLQPTDADLQEFVDSVRRNLPPLAHLETLRVQNEGSGNPLADLLVTRFSVQIRRLELDISLWREEYSQLFPNLTELDILQWDEELPHVDSMNDVKQLLNSLEAPQLSKLDLRYPFASAESNVPLSVEDDLFRWLRRFPQMKYIDLGSQSRHLKMMEKGDATDCHPSLQYLSIRSSFEMRYDFLRSLPALQHLELWGIPSQPVILDLSTNPAVKIKEEIQTGALYRSNIWEVLPKLRTVVLNNPSSRYSFTRKGYIEYERKKRGDGLSSVENEDFPLRKDIVKFLSSEVERASGSGVEEFDSEEENDSEEWEEEEEHDLPRSRSRSVLGQNLLWKILL